MLIFENVKWLMYRGEPDPLPEAATASWNNGAFYLYRKDA